MVARWLSRRRRFALAIAMGTCLGNALSAFAQQDAIYCCGQTLYSDMPLYNDIPVHYDGMVVTHPIIGEVVEIIGATPISDAYVTSSPVTTTSPTVLVSTTQPPAANTTDSPAKPPVAPLPIAPLPRVAPEVSENAPARPTPPPQSSWQETRSRLPQTLNIPVPGSVQPGQQIEVVVTPMGPSGVQATARIKPPTPGSQPNTPAQSPTPNPPTSVPPQLPSANAPQWQAPQWQAPQWQAPQWQGPQGHAPQGSMPPTASPYPAIGPQYPGSPALHTGAPSQILAPGQPGVPVSQYPLATSTIDQDLKRLNALLDSPAVRRLVELERENAELKAQLEMARRDLSEHGPKKDLERAPREAAEANALRAMEAQLRERAQNAMRENEKMVQRMRDELIEKEKELRELGALRAELKKREAVIDELKKQVKAKKAEHAEDAEDKQKRDAETSKRKSPEAREKSKDKDRNDKQGRDENEDRSDEDALEPAQGDQRPADPAASQEN